MFMKRFKIKKGFNVSTMIQFVPEEEDPVPKQWQEFLNNARAYFSKEARTVPEIDVYHANFFINEIQARSDLAIHSLGNNSRTALFRYNKFRSEIETELSLLKYQVKHLEGVRKCLKESE